MSPYEESGVGGTSGPASLLNPANAAFSSALSSAATFKTAPQDPYGNVKIPSFEFLQMAGIESDSNGWYAVLSSGSMEGGFVWSSLAGLPTTGIPDDGYTDFVMITAYMAPSCTLEGVVTNCTITSCMSGTSSTNEPTGGASGANYIFTGVGLADSTSFGFASTKTEPTREAHGEIFTRAQCMINMSYVQVNVSCQSRACGAVGIRLSPNPAFHAPLGVNTSDPVTVANLRKYTVLGGDGFIGDERTALDFWPNLAVATNPRIACDTVTCTTSPIEAYLADPTRIFWPQDIGNPLFWQVGAKPFSHRMAQLINTYWINSIAAIIPAGNLTASHSVVYSAIVCRYKWFVILLIASSILFLAGLASIFLGLSRRGPEIIDSFSSLLKDNEFVDVPQKSSMEASTDRARRMRNVKVMFGDVKPDEEVGYAGIAVLKGSTAIQRLRAGRLYA